MPYPEKSSHYHKAVIEDKRRLTHQKSSDFYFSTNLTPQIISIREFNTGNITRFVET